jgi:hypothetical protein
MFTKILSSVLLRSGATRGRSAGGQHQARSGIPRCQSRPRPGACFDDATLRRSCRALHFFSRLGRLESRHADRALRLYCDPELVRRLLADAAILWRGVTGGAVPGRLAIALDAGPWPPYVIVDGCGDLVTCLGRGMRWRRPLLPWARVNTLLDPADWPRCDERGSVP